MANLDVTLLPNHWYAVAASTDLVGTTPIAASLLDRQLVIYRTAGGQVVVLDDRCPHRGASLAYGQVKDNAIACPYHGWQFAPDGHCVHIPSQKTSARIPQVAKVATYPVQERYGLIWVFTGDRDRAGQTPLWELPEYEQPGWRVVQGQFDWAADYRRVTENGMDVAHSPFVHANSFGASGNEVIADFELEKSDRGAQIWIPIEPKANYRGSFNLLGRKQEPPKVGRSGAAFHLPNITRIDIEFGNFHLILVGIHQPTSATTTRSHWLHIRNFLTAGWADSGTRRRTAKLFQEDQRIIEGILPLRDRNEISVASDRLQLHYRQLWQQQCDRSLVTQG
ncbi:aromatic ring-hydroxylating oxygenase subunit alpha [Synechococcus elongatus]|uniref:Aromatic ring-hydroxylating dioxygenase subunit alpha n=1 Tax=Synechococcus elongatus PCC 11802 TaxID=2283154 RepID=A0AAU6R4Z6_SYNEL|nr:aromatic ring-hydroxylating dioxygenase subunit alpha [Synechococcus elongatus]QFZ92051.1 aromatic ring-hydroxylating dioxygenase subunit alpha [Synechococcus elongatus PCC 11802]